MQRFYPNITAANLAPFRLIREQMKHFPDYLTAEQCPYDQETKDFLAIFAEKTASQPQEAVLETFVGAHGDKWAALEHHALRLYNDLAAFGKNISTSNTAEKMTFFRTMTSLLDKITSINERAHGLRRVSEFQRIIIEILDEICNEDQRTEVMERIRAVLGEEPKPEDFEEPISEGEE